MSSRRFLNRLDFDSLSSASSESSKPRLQIQKWRDLEIDAIFRVLNIVQIPTDPIAAYVVLETEKREVINVWITPIIFTELRWYDLSQGSVFIKPLGIKLSNSTGNSYFNFQVVLDTTTCNNNDEKE